MLLGGKLRGLHTVPNQIVNACMKKVGDQDHRPNVRLDVVIFVFVDRLLAHGNCIGELLLRDAGLSTEFPQIFEHCTHLIRILTTIEC